MAEKVTEMVLEADLQCQRCYKKVKKVLCKFPQIRDQAYDEKKNVVKIKVFCCNPEKIRDQLCCKGGGSIKSIEIIKKPDPKPEPKPDPAQKPASKPVASTPTEQAQKPASKPVASTPTAQDQKPAKPIPDPVADPPLGYRPCYPRGACCGQCYAGQAGGPCYYGCGRQPPAGCDGYGYGYCYGYGYGYGYDYGWNRGCSLSRCGECFSDENPAACVIM